MSNLYTGSAYPKTSWVFDRIYNSLDEATKAAKNDGVLVGRYVLIMYCEEAFGQNKRLQIENGIYNNENEAETSYYNNFVLDGNISRDRNVYRKAYDKEKGYYYQLITTLRTDLSDETLQNFSNVAAADWNIITPTNKEV